MRGLGRVYNDDESFEDDVYSSKVSTYFQKTSKTPLLDARETEKLHGEENPASI